MPRSGERLVQALDGQVDHGHRLTGRRGLLLQCVGEFLDRAVPDPGDGGDHGGVDGRVVQRLAQGEAEVPRGGGGGQVPHRPGTQPLGEGGVIGEQAQRLGVAEDGEPRAVRQRLVRQQHAGVDLFGDGVHHQHAGLPQQAGHGRVRRAGCAGGMAGRRRGGAVPGALDDDERLADGDAPRKAGELARIADGLEVHQGDVGVRIVVPVLQQVVAGHVGTVAGGDERGQARAPPVQAGQQRDADRAGLGEQADAAACGDLRRGNGVEPHAGRGVDGSEGVGADDPHAE